MGFSSDQQDAMGQARIIGAMAMGRLIGGVDEAGRGPLAGPVIAACVILPASRPTCQETPFLDSKLLKETAREQLFELIRRIAVAWAVGIATPREIEQLNIHRASLLAMRRAVERLPLLPEWLLIDGRHAIPGCPLRQQAIIDGDAKEEVIAAASIVAKVVRDRLMREYDRLYPAYGFAQHKGYATPFHLQQLHRLGPCPIHRRTFEPVASLLDAQGFDTDPLRLSNRPTALAMPRA
jgi:ribonuclease HII